MASIKDVTHVGLNFLSNFTYLDFERLLIKVTLSRRQLIGCGFEITSQLQNGTYTI